MQQGSEGSGGWMELWRWMLVGRWCAAKMSKNGEYLRQYWADFPETWTVGKRGKRAFWWCVKMWKLIRRNLRYGGNKVGRSEGHQQAHKRHCKRAQRGRLITCRVLCPLDKCKRQRGTQPWTQCQCRRCGNKFTQPHKTPAGRRGCIYTTSAGKNTEKPGKISRPYGQPCVVQRGENHQQHFYKQWN